MALDISKYHQNSSNVTVELKDAKHFFSHESRLKEAKGGYVEGVVKFPGLVNNDDVEEMELSLVSALHYLEIHCNLLHLTGTGRKRPKGNDTCMNKNNFKICLKRRD